MTARIGMPCVGAALAFLMVAVSSRAPFAQGRLQGGLASLKTVSVPAPTGIDRYVRDARTLVVLGKAFFWDMQVGSDSRTACATCHFHAGADHRRQNQLASTPDVARSVPLNRVLNLSDFPFVQFRSPDARDSDVIRDTRWIAGSAGVRLRQFVDIASEGTEEHAADAALQGPNLGGLKIRQVTTRNTPTVINAALNVRNFHDGRASHVFTGITPFGDSDTAMSALLAVDGVLQPHRVRIDNASLASQAVGPPLNLVEMSYAGRTWPKVGKKVLPLVALANQQVAPDDSVLGGFANRGGPGLRSEFSYATLIRAAFRSELWESSAVVDTAGRVLDGVTGSRTTDEFTQMEFNFPIFWGLAIQAYESTLISDDAPFDRFAEGNEGALSDVELQGLNDFQASETTCTTCHGGPEFTAASFTNVSANSFDIGRVAAFGFFRIGVSPIADDIGAGGRDGFGLPLFPAASQDSTRGTFKAPTLRNVELTGPYFHTGGTATLGQVIDFYRRRPDFQADGNLGPGLLQIAINGRRRTNLVAFLRTLTDDRVKFERAPFDHPAICVPTGHPEQPPGVLLPDAASPGAAMASDAWAVIPAVGRGGNTVPLQTFEELLTGIGNDGSRAHTMAATGDQLRPTPCGRDR